MDNLLREADASLGGPPALPPDLAQRVLSLARRRERRRAAAGAGLAVALIVTSIILWPRPANRPPRVGEIVQAPTPNDGNGTATLARRTGHDLAFEYAWAEANDARAELARLEAEADSAEAVTNRVATVLRQGEKLDRLRREAERPGIMTIIDEQLEQAALAAAQGAERQLRLLNQPQEAAKSFERIIRLYPQTAPAEIARRRLAEIRGPTGNTRHSEKEYEHEEVRLDDALLRGRSAPGAAGPRAA